MTRGLAGLEGHFPPKTTRTLDTVIDGLTIRRPFTANDVIRVSATAIHKVRPLTRADLRKPGHGPGTTAAPTVSGSCPNKP